VGQELLEARSDLAGAQTKKKLEKTFQQNQNKIKGTVTSLQ
jgi:hypothetical protein